MGTATKCMRDHILVASLETSLSCADQGTESLHGDFLIPNWYTVLVRHIVNITMALQTPTTQLHIPQEPCSSPAQSEAGF